MLPIGMVSYILVHHLNRRVLKSAQEGVARLKTLRMGVSARSLRSNIRCSLACLQRLDLRQFNCNAVAPWASADAEWHESADHETTARRWIEDENNPT